MELRQGYKQTEVGVIPEDWGVHKLGAISIFLDGQRKPVKSSDRAKMQGDIPYYGASGIVDYVNDYIFDDDLILLGEDGENILSRNLPLAFRISGKTWVNNHAHVIKPHSDISIGFLTEYLESLNYENLNSGTAQPKLNKQKCLSIPIALPPTRKEQAAIATALSDVDALLDGLERLIAKKRDIKQAAMQQLLTGQTRLPGFEGEWVVKRLEHSCELITKGTTPTSIGRNFKMYGVNFLKAESLSETGKPLPDKFAFIDTETHKVLKRSQLKNGDLLISIAGVLGRVGRVSKNILPANTNQALAIVRLGNSSEIERSFLFYCLRAPVTTKQINDVIVQAAQANISLQNVRELEIYVPPTLPEQTAIAAVLSDMDAELAVLEQRRDKTRDLKQAMMQELLTGKTRLVSNKE